MPETLITQLKDPEARQAVTEVVMALLDRWGVHEVNQGELLGLSDMSSLCQGKLLPDNPLVMERVGHVLAIDRALQRLHPYRSDFRDLWVSLPDPKFGGTSPLELMLAEGIEGIKKVRAVVESELEASRGLG